MEKLSYNTYNPAILDAIWFQGIVARKGGCTRIIGNGGERADLKQIFPQSLLGLRLPGCRGIEEEVLTPHERSLLHQERIKILTVTDFDGVMNSPVHAFLKFLSRPSLWPGGLTSLKDLARIGIERWRWLLDVTSASDKIVVWTSRFIQPSDKIDCDFPYMSTGTLERIEKFGQGKLAVVTNKPFSRNNQALEEMLKDPWDIIYLIGSSHFDRSRALQLFKKHPDLAQRMVFFDTGHLLI